MTAGESLQGAALLLMDAVVCLLASRPAPCLQEVWPIVLIHIPPLLRSGSPITTFGCN